MPTSEDAQNSSSCAFMAAAEAAEAADTGPRQSGMTSQALAAATATAATHFSVNYDLCNSSFTFVFIWPNEQPQRIEKNKNHEKHRKKEVAKEKHYKCRGLVFSAFCLLNEFSLITTKELLIHFPSVFVYVLPIWFCLKLIYILLCDQKEQMKEKGVRYDPKLCQKRKLME